MKYLFIVIPLIVLIIIFYIIRNIKRSKNIKKQLTNLSLEKNFKLIEVKKKAYQYVIQNDNIDIYIKIAYVQKYSQICINSKETWRLNYSYTKLEVGRSYPNNRYMDELEYYLNNDIKTNKNSLKAIYLYKGCQSIIMYLNETELDTVDINKTPYGYKITSFNTIGEDIDKLLQYKK